MTANINPDTGIAYGYISADALDPDTVDELMYGRQAVDITYKAALEEWLSAARHDHDNMHEENAGNPEFDHRAFDEDAATEEFSEDYNCDEPTIEGEIDCPGYGPVQYATSWLGGALHFWIFKSPFTTDEARRASPCVPNAGILDTCDGDVTAYDVPADWRFQ